jgi:hypothetical protein
MYNAKSNTTVEVHAYAILRNMWEYYFLDTSDDVSFALVEGFEQEMGDVDKEEISPYVVSICDGEELNDILPAEGWSWVE